MSYMTNAEHAEFMKCHAYILKALRKQADRRHTFDDLEWITLERQAVMMAANEWAQATARNLVTVTDVERVEQRAVGHSDFAHKFALYVAELLYPATPKGTP